jgi:hypothetical protein
MTKAKAWDSALTEKAVSAYQAGTDLETIAKEMGKTVPAVRSKLVAEKVYQKPEARKVGGASSVRKMSIVRDVAKMLEIESLDSFEKATKADLETLKAALTELIGE